MKTIYSVIFAIICVTMFMIPEKSYAKVYASQLKVTNPDNSAFDGSFSDGTGALLSFFLNDSASVVTVDVIDVSTGASVATIDAGGLPAGENSVNWDGTGSANGKQYIFEITAEQPNASMTDWSVFFDSGDIDIFSRGCDVVTDMASPLFGLFFTPNNGGPLGKGIAIYNPDGSFHNPFLVARDISSGGTIDWGGGDPMFSGVFDDEERFYVSSINFGEIRRLNTDSTITTVITGLINPKGLFLVGSGAEKVLYICDDSTVVRAAIGNADVFTGSPELVGKFSNGLPRNIAIDDDGAMYLSFRDNNDLASNALGMNKYNISGTLPVTDGDADWFLSANITFRIANLLIDHGADPNTSNDDILYYSTRVGDGSFDDGLWRVDDVNFPFPTVSNLIDERDLYGNDDSANINDRTAIALDAAGNIIMMENSNEHIFFLSPPGEGATNSFTTTGFDTIQVTTPVSVRENNTPAVETYQLNANYPNPFNPSTTITYSLGNSGFTTINIYNLLGKEIRSLFSGQQTNGNHTIVWNSKDDSGSSVSSGVYVLRIQSGDFRQSIKMTLLK